jgi:predicted enzyme related to lactoylglutathione lyase
MSDGCPARPATAGAPHNNGLRQLAGVSTIAGSACWRATLSQMRSVELHNVTIYVEKSELGLARGFYRALFGGHPIWAEDGHIACFGSADLAICLHEAEPNHPAGTRELFFWTDDLDSAQADLEATGSAVTRVRRDMGSELGTVDPAGNQIRVHRRRP